MIIIAGALYVRPEDRIDPGRINVFERWESDELVARSRAGELTSPTEPVDVPEVLDATVYKYRISSVEAP